MNNEMKKVELNLRKYELPLYFGLVITWMALWRDVSLLTIISGFLVAFFLMRVLYLPPVEIAASFNIFYLFRFLGYFLYNLAVASISVAWLAIRPKKVPDCSIIEVKLRTKSDFIMTATGLTISLIPGSFIVDSDREEQTLYLHVLGAGNQKEIAKMRAEVWRAEELLIRAVGNEEDRAVIKK